MTRLRINVVTANVWQRAAWGASWGAIFGVVCACIALLQYLVRGAGFETRYQLTLPTLAVAYLGGCIVAGALVGLLLPLGKWRPGAALVGFLAILPVGAAIELSTLTGSGWTRANTFVLIVGAVGIGVPVGAIYHAMFLHNLRDDKRV